MKKMEQSNPYEKVLDDARRRLKKAGISLDHLDKISGCSDDDKPTIPFPYGGTKKTSSWNSN